MTETNQGILDNCPTAIQEACDTLTELREEEDMAYDNLPESIREGVRGDEMSAPASEPEAKVDSAPPIQEAPVSTTPAKEKGIGCFGWFFAITLPLIFAVPLTALIYFAYKNGEDATCLLMILPIVVIYIFLVRILAKSFKVPFGSSSPNDAQTYHDDGDDGQDAAFMGGLLGGYFLGKAMNKDRKSLADRMRDDIFWQEKYRRHDDYHDEEDW